MTIKYGPIPINNYQLQPLIPLYMVTGLLETQILACQKSYGILWFLARLLSHSGCSNAYDNQVWSHNLQLLPIAAIETPVYGHRTL